MRSTDVLFLLATAVQAFVTPPRPTPTAFVTPTVKSVGKAFDASARFITSQKRQQQNVGVLFMGWGPEPVWSTAQVQSKVAANQSGKSVSITVAVPPETAAEYKVPGQYVQFRLNEATKPLFLAISSAPNTENAEFEFLIKKTPDNGWITDDATTGTKVEISQVLGGGFPMSENLEGFKYDFPTQNILLFGAGSGIAPIKAAMESGEWECRV